MGDNTISIYISTQLKFKDASCPYNYISACHFYLISLENHG